MEQIDQHKEESLMRRIRVAFTLIGIMAFIIGSASVIYSTFIFSKVVVSEEVQAIGLVGTLTSNAWITMFWSVLVAEISLFFLYKFIVSEHKHHVDSRDRIIS